MIYAYIRFTCPKYVHNVLVSINIHNIGLDIQLSW
jgi:hypothetical protein